MLENGAYSKIPLFPTQAQWDLVEIIVLNECLVPDLFMRLRLGYAAWICEACIRQELRRVPSVCWLLLYNSNRTMLKDFFWAALEN